VCCWVFEMMIFILSGPRESVIFTVVVHCLESFFFFFQEEGLSSNCIIEIHGYTIFLFIGKGNYFLKYDMKILTTYVVWWSEFLAIHLEVQVRFLALPDFLRSSGSATGSTEPREYQ
jgi:hypothetical protein